MRLDSRCQQQMPTPGTHPTEEVPLCPICAVSCLAAAGALAAVVQAHQQLCAQCTVGELLGTKVWAGALF
jgi:hypothetical protein